MATSESSVSCAMHRNSLLLPDLCDLIGGSVQWELDSKALLVQFLGEMTQTSDELATMASQEYSSPGDELGPRETV